MCRFRDPDWHWPCYLISRVFIEPVHWPIGVTAVEQDSDHEAVSFNAWKKMTPSMTSRAPDPYFSQWGRGHGCAPVNLRSMPATQAGQHSGSWNLWSILEFCHFQTIQQEMSKVLHIPYVVHVSWNNDFRCVPLYVFHNFRSLCTTSRKMALWFLCVSTQWSSPSNMTTTFHWRSRSVFWRRRSSKLWCQPNISTTRPSTICSRVGALSSEGLRWAPSVFLWFNMLYV